MLCRLLHGVSRGGRGKGGGDDVVLCWSGDCGGLQRNRCGNASVYGRVEHGDRRSSGRFEKGDGTHGRPRE